MLRLIKYDFRRSRDRILAFFVIMLLAQAAIWISNGRIGTGLFIAHIFVYLGFEVAVMILSAITYSRNLKAYHRRLLPVNSINQVLSPLVLCWMMLIIITLVAALHLRIIFLYSQDVLPGNFWSVIVRSMLILIWSAGFALVLIMFSITTAASLRVKGRIWVGVATLVVLQNGLEYLMNLLFKSYSLSLDQMFEFDVYESAAAPSGNTLFVADLNFWPFLFEAGVMILLIYTMNLLVKNRVEA